MPAEPITVAQLLRREREGQGWSQRQAADLAGVSINSLIKWETGICIPAADVLIRLARAYGIDVGELGVVG